MLSHRGFPASLLSAGSPKPKVSASCMSAVVTASRSRWPADGARIILGSSSYSRQGIMKELAQDYGFAYETVTADIDEQALGDRTADPAALVTLLAQAKAEAICKSMKSRTALPVTGFLLTCDQVVICQDKIREKPISSDQAKAFIASYSQHPAGTIGSTLCTDLESGQSFGAVDRTWTYFSQIPEEVVQHLVTEGTVMKCAGALMIENPLLEPFITCFDGTKDAIMGLPKDTVLRLVAEAVNASGK
ncbi:hypothetical protein ABBQ32_013741 [Trebouxia sp. C0010 RCD-2024]